MKRNLLKTLAVACVTSVMLMGCGNTGSAEDNSSKGNTITVTDVRGNVEIPADPKVIQWFGEHMNKWMIDVPVEQFNCPVPFKTDFEIGVNWGDLGGTEFDYNVNPYGDNVINIEQPDDSIKQMSFKDWYAEVVSKEDRYDDVAITEV